MGIKKNKIEQSKLSVSGDSKHVFIEGILNNMWENIKKDNAGKVKELFNEMEDDVKEEILNGSDDQEVKSIFKKYLNFISHIFSRHKENLKRSSRPLFQAVMFGSFEVFNLLLCLGASLKQTTGQNWNIIHFFDSC